MTSLRATRVRTIVETGRLLRTNVCVSVRLKSGGGGGGGGGGDPPEGAGKRKSYIDATRLKSRQKPATTESAVDRKDPPETKIRREDRPSLGPKASLKRISVAEMYNVKSLRDALKVEFHTPLTSKRKAKEEKRPAISLYQDAELREMKKKVSANLNQSSSKAPLKKSQAPKKVSSPKPRKTPTRTTLPTSSIDPKRKRELHRVADVMLKDLASDSAPPSRIDPDPVGRERPERNEESLSNSSNESLVETSTRTGVAAVLTAALDASRRPTIDRDLTLALKKKILPAVPLPLASGETGSPSLVVVETLSRALRPTLEPDRDKRQFSFKLDYTHKIKPEPSRQTMNVTKVFLGVLNQRCSFVRHLGPKPEPPRFDQSIMSKEESVHFRNDYVASIIVGAITASSRHPIERDLDAGKPLIVAAPEEVTRSDAAEKRRRQGADALIKDFVETAKVISEHIGEVADHGGMVTEAFERKAEKMVHAVTSNEKQEDAKTRGRSAEAIADEIKEENADDEDRDDPTHRSDLATPKFQDFWTPPSMKDTWQNLVLANRRERPSFPEPLPVAEVKEVEETVEAAEKTLTSIAELPEEATSEEAVPSEQSAPGQELSDEQSAPGQELSDEPQPEEPPREIGMSEDETNYWKKFFLNIKLFWRKKQP